MWKQGIDNKLFHPEFHGREHLNVARWMRSLRQNQPETRLAFDLNLYGISTSITSEHRKSYQAAFDVETTGELEEIKEIIKDGLSLFREIFGYQSKSLIAPNYIWPTIIEKDLIGQNIYYIKGSKVQISPNISTLNATRVYHYTGQKNTNNQVYLVRNCSFEPSLKKQKDSVNECLAQIRNAFRWNKPAIISSHRVNFIGSIDQSNRERNLSNLRILLARILKEWPSAEFMTADKLGDLISSQSQGA
jgi:hypothetical protein